MLAGVVYKNGTDDIVPHVTPEVQVETELFKVDNDMICNKSPRSSWLEVTAAVQEGLSRKSPSLTLTL